MLGALLDFDISAVTAAFDGANVYIAPRAALSLLTMTQVVTPFILNEGRNRQRIVKYRKRGFDAYMIDPNCAHTKQCVIHEESLVFQKAEPLFEPDPDVAPPRETMRLKNHPIVRCYDRVTTEQIRELNIAFSETTEQCFAAANSMRHVTNFRLWRCGG
jgi:uncharacterized Fe-S cluster protein YjdI